MNDPTAHKKYSKAKALAAKLGVHPKTIFRWSHDGRITRFKLNARIVLFDEHEVEQMIERSRVGEDLRRVAQPAYPVSL